MLRQLAYFPQEKIHLHLDRDMYVPGEKIWFKAYLVDASTHAYPTYSRYVYVELISPDSLISRVMVRPDENFLYYGYIPIHDVLPEGYYTIRAYTRYMENMNNEYFFTKNIRIGKTEIANNKQPLKNKKKNTAEKEDYDVAFFPEGGNLLEGTLCNLGFKVLNNNGLSDALSSGVIVDDSGTEIRFIETDHAGMGRFAFIPEKGKRYFLECTNTKGITKKFELPQANPHAYSLISMWRNDKLFISQKKSAGIPDIPTYILMHCRGNIIYFQPWDPKRGYIAFEQQDLPAGVLQIVLLDNYYNPISERLVFCKNEEHIHTHFQTDKKVYKTRDRVVSKLFVTDTAGIYLPSNLSVSVTDDKDFTVDESSTILSSLLLSSELKGHIEAPGYYFRNNDIKTNMVLDNLMLVQGWKRYDISNIIQGDIATPEKAFETSQAISGSIKSSALSKPIADGQVAIVTRDGIFGFGETDEKGNFFFNNFENPDSTEYYVQALNKKGSSNVQLEVNTISYPNVKYIPQNKDLSSDIITVYDLEDDYETFIEKANLRSRYDEEMRIINLRNVDVVASRIDEREKHLSWFTFGSDATIRREDVEKNHPVFVRDMLRGVSGVQVYPNGMISIRGSYNPLILIDGMVVESDGVTSPLELVTVADVDRIDVFKGASAAVFGSRGSRGAINITTRRGRDVAISFKEKINQKVFSLLGYQKPVEFYSPKYETPESKYTGNPDYRTTIFWKPDIITTEDSEVSFEFYAADSPTTYSVVIEGLTQDGSIVRDVREITVE